MKAEVKTIAGQKSWIVENGNIELALTQRGGQMAPVTFYRDTKKPVRPYYVNPWAEEDLKTKPYILDVLRGDFFCMPFGANNDYRKEKHDVHGETANQMWKGAKVTEAEGVVAFSVKMDTKERPGTITKKIMLKDGQNQVYIEHLLEGYGGKMTIGHHPTLAVPEKENSMLISTAPYKFGFTSPWPEEMKYTFDGEYHSLAENGKFTSLKKVPTVWKDDPYTDCTAFPKRRGFTDVLAVFAKPGKYPHWTAAVLPDEGYLWFSLKDPVVLPSTVMWMANHGRHAAPWNGRNLCIGLEDVCSYLAVGLAESAKKNPVSETGTPTVVSLSKTKPMAVRHIQGAVKVKKSFGRVKMLKFAPGTVTFVPETGKEISVPVDWEFLYE